MKFCPHCGGDLTPYMAVEQVNSSVAARPTGGKYEQDSIWRQLTQDAEALKGTPPEAMQIVAAAVDKVRPAFEGQPPISTIVHLATDRNIQPQGGVLYRATLLDGKVEYDPDKFKKMGYAVKDGHLVTVDDVPVSQAYSAITYWGGVKQHYRWHMAEPATVNPSRNGNPFFMDDNMIAFGVKWRDIERMEESLLDLCQLLTEGVEKDRCIGIPLALQLFVQ